MWVVKVKVAFLQIDFQFLMSAMATLFMMVGKFKGLLLCSSVLEGSNVIRLADSHLSKAAVHTLASVNGPTSSLFSQ